MTREEDQEEKRYCYPEIEISSHTGWGEECYISNCNNTPQTSLFLQNQFEDEDYHIVVDVCSDCEEEGRRMVYVEYLACLFKQYSKDYDNRIISDAFGMWLEDLRLM